MHKCDIVYFEKVLNLDSRDVQINSRFMSPGFGCRYSVVLVMMSSTARAVVSIFCKPETEKEETVVIMGVDERNKSAINLDL